MIIIINKLQIHGKRFCENCVTGSNLGERCGLMPSPRPSPTGRGRRARTVGRVSAASPGKKASATAVVAAWFSPDARRSRRQSRGVPSGSAC